jgi:thymidylate kinase
VSASGASLDDEVAVKLPGAAIREFLAAGIGRSVVLRNANVLDTLRRGGDIDLLARHPAEAEAALVGSFGAPRMVIRRSYVTGYFYEWGHVDVLPRLEWRGAVYLPTETVLQHARTTSEDVAVPRPAHEALVAWFSSLLWGGFFKERYADLITRAAREDAEAFRAACEHAVGRRWGRQLHEAAAAGRAGESVSWVRALRRAVAWQSFRRDPIGTTKRHARFWIREISLRLKPPLPWAAVLGPDGSGKSTVLAELASRFGPPVSCGVERGHWRPGRLRNLGAGAGPVTDPHGEPPRNAVGSTLKLGLLLADWVVGYWGDLVHRRAKGQLILFDRHYVDILIDPRRYRYGGPLWLAKLVGAFVPSPDVLVVLDAPVEVLHARKREVSEEEVARQRQAYRELAARTRGAHLVDAARPLEDVVRTIERILRDRIDDAIALARHRR